MLEFAPGTRALKCTYCGELNEIAASDSVIEEHDYAAQLLALVDTQPTVDAVVFHCDGCGGESTLPPGQSAGNCPFCGRAVVATAITRTLIKPKSLLPFAIDSRASQSRFDQWLSSLWFAPNDLKQHAQRGGLKGLYIPAWTYDAKTIADYTGYRGDAYYETQSYTTRVNGKSVRQTRQVRKIRWSGAAGRVYNTFDDVLVLADRSLPVDLRNKLSGWDLPNLVAYDDAYLSGFIAETYMIDLPGGFEIAKQLMEPVIRSTVNRDIGGDEQRISTLDVLHNDITFKHILLPVWISAYRYRSRTFHFIINARTGTVIGQRPYSAWKIAILVTIILTMILLGLLVYGLAQ
jgi:hypothetical protein